MDFIDLTQESDTQQALMTVVRNLQVPSHQGMSKLGEDQLP
jgi:hypothetical protein